MEKFKRNYKQIIRAVIVILFGVCLALAAAKATPARAEESNAIPEEKQVTKELKNDENSTPTPEVVEEPKVEKNEEPKTEENETPKAEKNTKAVKAAAKEEVKDEEPEQLYPATYEYYYRKGSGWIKGATKNAANNGKTVAWLETQMEKNAAMGPITTGNVIYTYNGTWEAEDGKTYGEGSKIPESNDAIWPEGTVIKVYACYDEQTICKIGLECIDNIGNTSGSWNEEEAGHTLTHTFKDAQDVPEGYIFLYWEDEENEDQVEAGESRTFTNEGLEEDTIFTYVAVYEYQPQVRVEYRVNGETIFTTDPSTEPIDIEENAPEVENLVGWFTNGIDVAEPDEPFETTELVEDGIKTIVAKAVLNGKDGQDGKDGEDGKDGQDGIDGTDGIDGKDGEDGKDGINGQDGKDGVDGKDGENGKDGTTGPRGPQGIAGTNGTSATPATKSSVSGGSYFKNTIPQTGDTTNKTGVIAGILLVLIGLGGIFYFLIVRKDD